jgi:HPr kinase/phosphorylase
MHGVFLNIFDIGVLITGKPGTGKSELALTLIDRGHQLIADDAPEFSIQNGILIGDCPPLLRGFLNSRTTGTINVEKIFGTNALKKSANLQLIINIDNSFRAFPENNGKQLLEIQNIKIPQITTKNNAILVEIIVHNFLLKQRGYDAHLDLIRKHHEYQRTNNQS